MLSLLREILPADLERTVPARFSLSRHLFSALALFFLFTEIVSGILLLAYYRPTAEGAFLSMGVLVDEVRLGWLVRSVHYWSAQFLILFALLHIVQSYFTHAYEAPRQLTWQIGVGLLLAFFAFAITGTLLPWDQYAYWYMELARQAIARAPYVGTALLSIFWGGWVLGEEVLLRFYVIHVAVLPWIAVILLFAHLVLVWRLGESGPQPAGSGSEPAATPFFPDFVVNVLILALFVTGILLTVATFYPPAIAGPADPLTPLTPVRPPWYFVSLDQVLRNFPGNVAALAVAGLTVIILLLPMFDGSPIRSSWRRIIRWVIGAVAIAGAIWLGVRGYLY